MKRRYLKKSVLNVIYAMIVSNAITLSIISNYDKSSILVFSIMAIVGVMAIFDKRYDRLF